MELQLTLVYLCDPVTTNHPLSKARIELAKTVPQNGKILVTICDANSANVNAPHHGKCA